MRENIGLKHEELREINEGIEQNENELQMLENKLKILKGGQRSKERYTGLLMSDLQVQQLECACKKDLELHIRQLELRQSPVQEEVREQFQQAQKSIVSLQDESSQLKSQIKSLRQASSDLTQQLQQMSSKVDSITHVLKGLQHQKKELTEEVHKSEQELDACLFVKSTAAPFVPAI